MNGGDNSAPPLVIFGAGGHARVLMDALRASGERRDVVILDADEERHGSFLIDARVIGGDEALASVIAAGSTLFAIGIGGPVSGDASVRRRLFMQAVAYGLVPLTIVHSRAIVSPFAVLAAGAQILAGAVVNAGSNIGSNTIVNSGAIVEHDCVVGDHSHIASGACLAGSVNVGNEAHVGAGATVRQGVVIGAHAVIAMGAAVITDVPAGGVVAGVPAKPLVRGRATSR